MKIVSALTDKAIVININSTNEMDAQAIPDGWLVYQRTGILGQDVSNIKSWSWAWYICNHIVGGNGLHQIGSPIQLYQVMAQKVRGAHDKSEESGPQNSIIDDFHLVCRHLLFKWSSIDPDVDCSEIITLINTEKVSFKVLSKVLVTIMVILW